MNCKPGDMAIIIRSYLAGKVVSVLYEAPAHNFNLPDNYPHVGTPPGFWICESLGAPFEAPVKSGGHRSTMFASINDSVLRPLRDDETTQRETEKMVEA